LQQRRIAFAAEYWGEGAVVCRAREDQPGPVVEQQFGVFETWTHANAFANKLNQGLDISPEDARQIVTSAMLARGELLRSEHDASLWRFRTKLKDAGDPRLISLLLELDTAVNICRSARLFRRIQPSERAIRGAIHISGHANEVLRQLDISEAGLEEIHRRLDRLQVELEAFPARAQDRDLA
jgi:hypothetical protein